MILDDFRLDRQVALITGAGKGIGAAIAEAFAEAGADVVLAARTETDLEQVASRVRALGAEALVVPTDVTDRKALEALVEATRKHFGRLTLLVNNAGGGPYKPALETSERTFEHTLRFSLTSAFLLTRLAARLMLEQDAPAPLGAVLNISSALDHQVERGFVAYATAKAGLAHMTHVLGHELAPKIRVNGLSVGSVETPALAPFLGMDGMREKMVDKLPMGRIGQPRDVASAAVFLCSPAASWITGKMLEVDGGAVASNFPMETKDL